MSKARFLNDNYIKSGTDLLVESTSSVNASYPFVNATNFLRRSKVYRTAGYWDIQSGSNTIIFRETVGVNKTATIPVAVYTSTTSLLAAIKTAMQAVGSSTYTPAVDTTTNKIKITSNGLGGGGIFQLRWTLSTAMAATLGYDATVDLTGSLSYTADVLKCATEEWMKWDLGQDLNPTAFVLAGPRNTTLKISPGATVTLQGNETDAWTSPSYQSVLTYNRLAFLLVDSNGLHTGPLRYWRLKIDDTSNPLGYVEIALLYLGDTFEPTRGGIQFPFTRTNKDLTQVSISYSGYASSSPLTKHYEFDLNYFGLTQSEKESLEDTFETYGKSEPFLVDLDPDQVIGSEETKHLHLVRFDKEPSFSIVAPGVFAAQISLREEL